MESLCPCVRLCRPHVLSVPASFPKHWQIRISSLRQHSLDERCKFTGGALVGAVLAVAVGPCRSTAKWRRRPDLKSVLPAAAFDADDVVVVYDRNSKQAGEVVVAVEQDSAMAPRPVSYAIVPSSDSAALLELARQRNLNDDCVERLRRDACACAVLPGGAMIEDLEMDPWPLLRELRYRTCLEHPSKDDIEALEETYFRPLRSLKAEWWKQPEALKSLAQQLDEVGFVLIDDFLPDEVIRRVKASNLDLYQNSEMQLGSTTGGVPLSFSCMRCVASASGDVGRSLHVGVLEFLSLAFLKYRGSTVNARSRVSSALQVVDWVCGRRECNPICEEKFIQISEDK
ncbi:unnamed protein product [Symbiodinium necroappetens]|uniref:Uncharacterized protein n=1 Tax=Symbiodinium necroappetens TaxID=1628268 RepID=A0A812Q4D6_9DINO|nr:unnamed protein product [Symbiodinium necroappetens]